MTFRQGLRDMLTSGGAASPKLSSKRVITFVAFILVCIAFIVNLIWGIAMDPNVLTGMINVVFAGLGVTVGEHLLTKNDGENPDGVDNNNDYGHNIHGDYSHDRHERSTPEVNVHVHTELGDN